MQPNREYIDFRPFNDKYTFHEVVKKFLQQGFLFAH